METKKFNVYIVCYLTDKAITKFASNLNEEKSENAEMMWLSRCNENFGCYTIEVWSEQDLKYSNDLLLT